MEYALEKQQDTTSAAGGAPVQDVQRAPTEGGAAARGQSAEVHASAEDIAVGRDDDDAKAGGAPKSAYKSERFQRDPTLEAVAAGKKLIRKGQRGLHVKKIQQALIDLRVMLPKYGVDGIFGKETDKSVRTFQAAEGAKEDGIVGPETMGKLDARYANFQPYVDQAKTATTPEKQMEDTRTLDGQDRAAIEKALAHDKPGPKGQFRKKTANGEYGPRLETALEDTTNLTYDKLAKGKGEEHKDEDNLYKWDLIEAIGVQAKNATDAVFKSYAQRDPLKEGVNLKDQWTEQENKQASMDDAQKLGVAKELTDYFLVTRKPIRAIKDEHNAANRPTEQAIEEAASTKVATARRDDLCEVEKGWPGEANIRTGEVRMQRFKAKTPEGHRVQMWKYFQTLIHEYLHTLTHKEYLRYANTKTGDRWNTLMEGMCDVFTQTVWASLSIDDTLRKAVEGPHHQKGVETPIPQKSTYPSTAQAQATIAIVGIKNAYAAYFLGKTELIGERKKP